MSRNMYYLTLCLAVSLFVMSEETELCNRLQLRGMNPKYVAYMQLEGVYRLTNLKWHGFPVLEHEIYNGVYFYYNEPRGNFFFGKDNQTSLGLGATVDSNFPADDKYHEYWISNTDEPLSMILDNWFQYDDVLNKNIIIRENTNTIGLFCVEEDTDFLPCSSDTFVFNEILIQEQLDGSTFVTNNPDIHSYKVLPGVYRDLRPVYKLQGSINPAYLYYCYGDRWLLGPDYNSDRGYLYAIDTAMSPEYISNVWRFYTNGQFRDVSTLKLQCSGLDVPGTGCNSTLGVPVCSNNGTCVSKSDNEVFCLCRGNYWGAMCDQELIQCPQISADHLPINSVYALWDGLYEGALARFTCASGHTPAYYYSRCVKDGPSSGSWQHFNSCEVITTAAPTPTTAAPTPGRQYFDDDNDNDSTFTNKGWEEPGWLDDFVLGVLIAGGIVAPFIIFLCVQRAKFLRTTSLFYWVMFWMYFFYLTGCFSTACGHYSDTLSIIAALGIISMPLLLIVLIYEAFKASERKYIKNLGKSENIGLFLKKVRASQPAIVWMVKCYHFETRTRTVYYTDAQGNSQSRLETYQEVVVTHVESKIFDFEYWYDDSAPSIEGVEKYKITRIKVDKEVSPGDAETARVMEEQKEDLQDRNRNRDTFMDFSEEHLVPGYKKRLAAFVNKSAKSWWMNSAFYWISTILVLNWPYRWLFRYNTKKTYYKIQKKVFISRPQIDEKDVKEYHADEDAVLIENTTQEESSNRDSNLTTIPVNSISNGVV